MTTLRLSELHYGITIRSNGTPRFRQGDFFIELNARVIDVQLLGTFEPVPTVEFIY